MATFDTLMDLPESPSMRKKRLQRSREQKPYIITPYVVEILVLLAKYKYLRSSTIEAMLPHRYWHGLRLTLRRMFDNGLIDRPREQGLGYNTLYCPVIYTLDKKGAEVLHERELYPPEVTRLWREKGGEAPQNISHAMMICDTLSSIEMGAVAAGYEFISWMEIVARTDVEQPLTLPYEFLYKGQPVRGKLTGDGIFGLRKNGKTCFYILEVERKNPNDPADIQRRSFKKKMYAYRAIKKANTHNKQLRIPGFEVLVVSPNATKSTNQLEVVQREIGESALFLFHPIPVQEDLLKAPPPFPALFEANWHRAGLPPTKLYTPLL